LWLGNPFGYFLQKMGNFYIIWSHCLKYFQFLLPQRKVPWKSIAYAVGLFVMGTILLICGCLIRIGHVDNERYGDRLWPLIIFGLLMFIPGKTIFLIQ
jgi:hypothetical protein